MSKYLTDADDVVFSEPILAQKGVRCGISFVEGTEWEVKEKEAWNDAQKAAMLDKLGVKAKAVKLTIQISDDSVKTEHEGAMPKLVIEDQFNIEGYPYPDKEGNVKKLGRQKLFQLEEALGFEPVFQVNGENVEAYTTRTGRKVAPKLEGVKRVVNPQFFGAYFDGDGNPKTDEWIGKTVLCDITLEKFEKFGDRNAIARYLAPSAV